MRDFRKLSFRKKLRRVYYELKNMPASVGQGLNNIYHYIRVRSVSPHNKVEMKQLVPDWIEPSEKLPHVIFTVLTDYLEKQLGYSLKEEPEKWYESYNVTEERKLAKGQYDKDLRLWRIYKWYWENYYPWTQNRVKYVISRGFPHNKEFIDNVSYDLYNHLKDKKKYKEAEKYFWNNWQRIEDEMRRKSISYMQAICQMSPTMWI